MMKRCGACGETKPVSAFHRYGSGDKRRGTCGTCTSAVVRAWNTANPRKALEYRLRARFGMTLAEYDAMVEKQAALCAICHKPEPKRAVLSVDHDHACCPSNGRKGSFPTCGKCVRGLICSRCNAGLSAFDDDEDALARAIFYLQRSRLRLERAS